MYVAEMLQKLVWFAAGLAAGAAGVAWIGGRAVKEHLRPDPALVKRAVFLSGADALDLIARRIRPRS